VTYDSLVVFSEDRASRRPIARVKNLLPYRALAFGETALVNLAGSTRSLRLLGAHPPFRYMTGLTHTAALELDQEQR
jgi:hypothetical protein